jgi:hypothetical protein
MPDLAKKTTFLWAGMFASNFDGDGMMKPGEIPGSHGSHVFFSPVSAETHIYSAGDEKHNTGVFVSAILKKPEVSLPAKYAFLYTEQGSLQGCLQPFMEVTGKRTVFVQVSLEQYISIWVRSALRSELCSRRLRSSHIGPFHIRVM